MSAISGLCGAPAGAPQRARNAARHRERERRCRTMSPSRPDRPEQIGGASPAPPSGRRPAPVPGRGSSARRPTRAPSGAPVAASEAALAGTPLSIPVWLRASAMLPISPTKARAATTMPAATTTARAGRFVRRAHGSGPRPRRARRRRTERATSPPASANPSRRPRGRGTQRTRPTAGATSGCLQRLSPRRTSGTTEQRGERARRPTTPPSARVWT